MQEQFKTSDKSTYILYMSHDSIIHHSCKVYLSHCNNNPNFDDAHVFYNCMEPTGEDIKRIRSGQCLQSDQIHLAVQLIRKKYPQQQGLIMISTLLLQKPNELPNLPPDSIQIHHVEGNHWVCSKNNGTQAKLYDSLNNGWLSSDLNSQLCALYSTDEGSLGLRVKRVQQQGEQTVRGLFAIVYALSLASGEDPSQIKYKQGDM